MNKHLWSLKVIDEGNCFSFWLMPKVETRLILENIIKNISDSHQTVVFKPHLTLIGDLKGSAALLWNTFCKGIGSVPKLHLEVGSVDYEDFFFKSITLSMKTNSALFKMRRRTEEIFELSPGTYHPHLSLMYSQSVSERSKLKIIHDVISKYPKSIVFDRIALYSTIGKVFAWKEIKSYPLE
jgi:2'-5' RNA ligase